ncbi:MAG: glycoside hydrolase family 92 protein [Bacteroidales bacterium]|nr:MAG: glycoside hydrolase family 92 protein [Bacteroidales bacterium]
MKKPQLLAVLMLISIALFSQEKSPVEYVNPFIGTDFHGHTYPGATVPYGLVQLSPDTRLTGWDGCSGYHYSDNVIYGFSHTHLSGTGASDYGDILIAPVTGKPIFKNTEYSSTFQKKNETAKAGYYSVYLDKFKVKAEMSATARVGFHRYTFDKPKKAALVIDLEHRDKVLESWIKVVGKNELHGFRRSKMWAKDQHIYFVIRFSEPISMGPNFVEKDEISLSTDENGQIKTEGKNLKLWLQFANPKNGQLLVKVGVSAVSEEGALKNLEAELPSWDFDAVVADAQKLWNTELSRIDVSGGTPEQLTTFYTSLYHAMVVPNVFSDVDGQYRGMDNQIHQADGFTPYTVFSLWDTYRAWHPLMTIIDTKRTGDYINTFLSHYRFGGRLPVWELAANETECMIGYHSVPVIVDAWKKGIRNFDEKFALQAMKHSAKLDHFGLKEFKQHNFIPGDMEHESVSKTLEYAYDDWCIAQFAKDLGENSDYVEFTKRAQAYKNLFDPTTRFMRPRINGGWKDNFNPAEVDQNFTEANSWQYSFYVPQDIVGLIKLHGGKDNFEKRLDDLFSTSSQLSGKNQVDITGLIGQYAHGNEPSHHMAYLYNYVGKPWKTQQMVRKIMDEMYTHKPDGICGNEDCGQMSAWYILSAAGFYPVCPGSTQYVIGSPLFPKATFNLENGKQFTIIAQNNSPQNIYIAEVFLNGQPLTRSWIDHSEIVAGGELKFVMTNQPNNAWASSDSDMPVTKIEDNTIAVAPAFHTSTQSFTESLELNLSSIQPEAMIFYALFDIDKQGGGLQWRQGNKVVLTESKIVKAYAVLPSGETSAIIEGKFVKVKDIKDIAIKSEYSSLYTGGGKFALVDGFRGITNFRVGGWQGFHNQDFEAVIDLGEEKEINYMGANFLQDIGPWIMMPKMVTYSTSNDNVNFTTIGVVSNTVSDKEQNPTIKEFGLDVKIKARYVKVFAKSYGKLPADHISAGEPSWIFIDEIVVK